MRLATPAGLEPATCRLEGGCSIQLSYGVGLRQHSSSFFLNETNEFKQRFLMLDYRKVGVNESIGQDDSI